MMRKRTGDKPARRRGTVLILALWVALGLVSLALHFGQTARWSVQAGANTLAGAQAEQAIEGARRYLMFVFDQIVEAGDQPDVDAGDYVAENAHIGDSRFWLIGRNPDSDVAPDSPEWGLVDEASKLNLNTATQEMLQALPNMTSALAAAIVDWRDADSELSPEGAESIDYESLSTPYSAKDGPFESVEELRLVMGVTPTILWGEDVNGNGILDPNEDDGDESWPDDDADGRLDPGLAEYVTVWTREPNTRSDGSPRIDVSSQSSRAALRQLLEATFGTERANQVIQRIGNPPGGLRSPIEFFLVSGLSPEEYARIEDALTVGGGDYRVGLVNIRSASAAVLACLPGMDAAKAASVVAERRRRDDSALASTAWIVAVLDEATVREMGRWITSKSYQFSADVVAVASRGRGLRRDWMVFDRGDHTRVIYRRDRTRLGWPLGNTLRKELKTPADS